MGGLNITGYILEPPRVGSANSPFTVTPNVFISTQATFDVAYPTAETEPRTEYHVFVLQDGKFPDDVEFCWTKNEIIARFDYFGREQHFRALPGAPLTIAGVLATDSNTNRLSVRAPTSTDLSSFPFRLSVGVDSGTTFTVSVVDTDGDFGTPVAGTVEVSQATGNLNWNASDLTTFQGQDVRVQQQQFFLFDASDGNIGLIDDVLLLNPLPTDSPDPQFPLIRIGFGEYLTPVSVATEGGFSADPAAGTVEWAEDTGRLKFNSGDIAANTGRPIYYDGVVFGFGLTVTPTPAGTLGSPSPFPDLREEDDNFFRVPGTVQFAETVFVDTLTPFPTFGKRGVVEVRRSDGQVQFSLADQVAYGFGTSVELVVPNIDIERGMTLRWFRTPVDLEATDATLNDISAFYESTGATLADPILQTPSVFLPAIPVDTLPLTVTITQGTGSFTSNNFPRLDVASPPTGFGYILNSDDREFVFAQRREGEVTVNSPRVPFSSIALSNPLVSPLNLTLELETSPGSGAAYPSTVGWDTLTLGTDAVINHTAGLVTLTETDGTLVTSGTGASFSGTTFTDPSQDFSAAGVVSGDLLVVLSGPAEGVYTVDTVGTTTLTTDVSGGTETDILYEIRRGSEVLVDRFFREIPPLDPNTSVERLQKLGATTNSPRLSIDLATVDVTRFRFGPETFSTIVTQVANDAAFTPPASLPQGEVEVSLDTGNLNFSDVNVTAALDVFQSRTLVLGTEYLLQPALGFIELTDRMLEDEELFITYAIIDDDDNKVIVEERGRFIVRKQLTEDHPTPTSTLSFNPEGKEVAATPAPQAFRGGRPQTSNQVTFNLTPGPGELHSVTFLPSDQVTDALPSGSTVNPNERVYIDFFILQALGGEQNITVIQEPIVGATVTIDDGTNSFTIAGDRTSEFPSNHLVRIDREEIYLIAGSTYDAGTELTTVTIAAPQEFRTDYLNPVLEVTSGQTRPSALLLFPSYFVTEPNSFRPVPRGNNKFRIFGDVSDDYATGTIVFFDGGGSFTDYNYVTGSTFDEESNTTVVVLTANVAREYTSATTTLKRSVRPVLGAATGSVTTQRDPVLDLDFTVFRRVEGEVGQILTAPDDFDINASGVVTFADPLVENEELSILYTGTRTIDDGRNFRASFTHTIAPNESNGILNQILKMDYTTYLPDSVYWRVETMTNFRGEVSEQYSDDAQAGAPTGGPILENTSQPSLFEQGRESIFFEEGRLLNEDLIARPTLKYFNDAINFVEDCLEAMDGRVVGDGDGRFIFDGLIDNPPVASIDLATNQIDDLVEVGVEVISITFPTPPFITFGPAYQEAYKPAQGSRFFPTKRIVGGVALDATGLETGDLIMDLGFKNLASVESISRRLPWAVVTEFAPAGSTTLTVDTTDGTDRLFRPPFEPGVFLTMPVVIQEQDGTFIIDDVTANLSSITITGVTSTTITISTGVPSDVPVGATVRVAFFDTSPPVFPLTPFPKNFRPGFDLGVDLSGGALTHIEPFPPFDGTVFSNELDIQRVHGFPTAGRALDAILQINNRLTEPYRFPALDGSTLDDDNNRQFPILTPNVDSEAGVNPDGANLGTGNVELSLIETGGTLRTLTEPAPTFVGSLNAARDRITLDSGTFPAPAPEVNDLVRITSGSNAGLSYRRVTAVSTTFVEVGVGDEWPTQEAGIDFTVTVSSDIETGTGAVTLLTTLTDAGATFQTNGVEVGYTVVAESGVNLGLRRQVTGVTSETVLTTEPWPANDAAMLYRVDNPLATFGGTGSVHDDQLVPAVATTLAVLDTNANSQRTSLEDFLDHVLIDVFTGSAGETSVGGFTFTDTSVDFTTQGISLITDFIFMRTGASAGFYKLDPAGTITTTTLPTDPAGSAFPATATGLSYRIVTPDQVGQFTLDTVFDILVKIDTAISDTEAFETLITTAITVSGDAGAFARGTLTTDLDTRETQLTTRLSDLETAGGDPDTLSSVLSSGDRLYDRRFVWIDARINLENGILPKKDRSVENREKAQANTLKALTKLLTT